MKLVTAPLVLRPAFATLILAGLLFGQVGTTSVVGRIIDASDTVVPNARVELIHEETNEQFQAITTSTGDYTVNNLPIGTYEVRAIVPGFRTESRKAALDVGRSYRFDFKLQVGQVTETVQIIAQTPLLKTESPETSTTIGARLLGGIPQINRDVIQALAVTAPSVAPTRQAGGREVRITALGNRQIDNTVFFDGAVVSGNRTSINWLPNPDALEQMEIKPSLYSAEFGIRPGAQVVLVTKSGTNGLHGGIYEYLRNDNLDARNFFDRGRRPEFKRNQFGANLGGPIVLPKLFNGKNRDWFFVACYGERVREFVSLTRDDSALRSGIH